MRRILLSATSIAVTGLLIWLYFGDNENKKIKKQFARLSDCIAKQQGEGNISALYKLQVLGSLFSESCEIEIPKSSLSGTYSPEGLVSNVARGKIMFSKMKLDFYDLVINISGKDAANIIFTARFTATSSEGASADETREIEAIMKKTDGKWLFSSLKVIELLEK